MSLAGTMYVKHLLDGEWVVEKKFAWLPKRTTDKDQHIWFKRYRRVVRLTWHSTVSEIIPTFEEIVMLEKDYQLFHLMKLLKNETIYDR